MNVSIRVASPGDNGAVSQTIAAATQATASTVNAVTQAATQTNESSAGVSLVQNATNAAQAIVAGVNETFAAVVEAAAAVPVVVPQLPELVLPPSSAVAVVVPFPTVAVTELGIVQLPPAPAAAAPSRPKRPRPAFTPQPQEALDAGFAGAWRAAPQAQPRPSSQRSKAEPPSNPRVPFAWPSIPVSASSSGAPGIAGSAAAAAALAALLASYLLVPPFGARRVRVARDRRRLRPRASRLERPG